MGFGNNILRLARTISHFDLKSRICALNLNAKINTELPYCTNIKNLIINTQIKGYITYFNSEAINQNNQ